MVRKALLSLLLEKTKTANRKLLIAMGCYLILILVAVSKLDGFLLAAILFFFAILVVKTIVHSNEDNKNE